MAFRDKLPEILEQEHAAKTGHQALEIAAASVALSLTNQLGWVAPTSPAFRIPAPDAPLDQVFLRRLTLALLLEGGTAADLDDGDLTHPYLKHRFEHLQGTQSKLTGHALMVAEDLLSAAFPPSSAEPSSAAAPLPQPPGPTPTSQPLGAAAARTATDTDMAMDTPPG